MNANAWKWAAVVGLVCLVDTSSYAQLMPMKKRPDPAPSIQPDEGTAVVSFVRRLAFLNDGNIYDIWDGEHYIGRLGADSKLQYRAMPGEHTFLIMEPGIQKWTFLKADLVAGKEYFARAYPIPLGVRAADAHADERIEEWVAMPNGPPLSEQVRAKRHRKMLKQAQSAMAALTSGEVKADCALWYPPRKQRKARNPPNPKGGACLPLGKIEPWFGR